MFTCINHVAKRKTIRTNNLFIKYYPFSINIKQRLENLQHKFKFTDYNCIGFDLDNTLGRYKVDALVTLEYNEIANYLVNKKGYPRKHLLRPLSEEVDFLLRGLILDNDRGNILQVSPQGNILLASHGTKSLSLEETQKYYGSTCLWDVANAFCMNPLETLNGPLSFKMQALLDYFDMPTALIFARAVDTLDEKNNGKPLDTYNIYLDILDAYKCMFQPHFADNKCGFYAALKNNPSKFYHGCSGTMLDWMQLLRRDKKILFLITGSYLEFAEHTAKYTIGPDWKQFFDIIIFFAKKPGFFLKKRPFLRLGNNQISVVANDDLINGEYINGNWNGLLSFLRKKSKQENPRIAYIGDHLIQDIYTPAVKTKCDAILVCEELLAEDIISCKDYAISKSYLTSNYWGSYFSNKSHNTVWKDMIIKYPKHCFPLLEYAASFPIHHEFSLDIFNENKNIK